MPSVGEPDVLRTVQLLPGVGEATARGAIAALASAAWDSAAFARYTAPARARTAHAALVALLDDLRRAPDAEAANVSADIARGVLDHRITTVLPFLRFATFRECGSGHCLPFSVPAGCPRQWVLIVLSDSAL